MSIATSASAPRGTSGVKTIDVSAIGVLAAPTPADKPALRSTEPVPPRFAEMLRQNRVELQLAAPPAPAPPPVPTPMPAPDSETAECAAPAAAPSDAKVVAANAAKARANAPKAASGKAVVDSPDKATATERSDGSDDHADDTGPAASTAASGDRVDPRVVAAAGADGRPLARTSGADGDAASGLAAVDRDAARASGDAAGASNGAARRGLGQGRAAAATDAASDRRASAVDTGRDAALRAGVDASFHAALSSAGEANDPRSAAPSREHAIDALTASLAAGAANRMAEQSPGTTATVALALSTPIDAPDFAATLGVQVSVLAQDGVQQAELHLNPAEMGPVSIHISLDGTAARVDFGADVAATRQAIERGLPELASALRDAGFTLAGGGVSSHAGGRPNGEDDAARATHRSDGGDSLTGATSIAASVGTVVRSVGTGGVDLYA